MENISAERSSYLYNLEHILFGEQSGLTDQDYFDVVQRSIGPKIGRDEWEQIYSYARENISDADLQVEALLLVAHSSAKSLNVVHPTDPYGRSWNHRVKPHGNQGIDTSGDGSQWIFGQAKQVVQDTLPNIENASQDLFTISYKAVMELETALEPVKADKGGPNNRGYYSTKIRGSRGQRSQFIDKEALDIRQELAAMTVSHLDTIRSSLPDMLLDLDRPIHLLYMDQLAFAPRSEVGDQIISTTLEQIDEETDAAIDLMFSLLAKAKDDGTKKVILNKALDITEKSSKEQLVETRTVVTKKRLFGQDKTAPVETRLPSPFETNLDKLTQGHKDGHDTTLKSCDSLDTLRFYPEYVRRLIELHTPDKQQALWESISDKVANVAFDNGSYDVERIGEVRRIADLFEGVAPKEVYERTKQAVRDRLAQSYAQTLN